MFCWKVLNHAAGYSFPLRCFFSPQSQLKTASFLFTKSKQYAKIQFVIQTLWKLTKLSLSSRFISAGLKSNRALQSAAGWDGWRCSTRGVWLAATNTPSLPSLPGYLFSTFCFMVMLGPEGSSVPPNEPACRFRFGALTES